MNAEKDKAVSIEYTLKDDEGTLLDSSEDRGPLTYLHGAQNIVPGLESQIEGKAVGDQLTAVVEPEQAYGLRTDDLVEAIPRENLPDIPNLAVGMQLEAQTPEGIRIVLVTAMDDETVTIDANHPLAGETLHFDVTVVDVRDATADELEHGHIHGPGCDHDHE